MDLYYQIIVYVRKFPLLSPPTPDEQIPCRSTRTIQRMRRLRTTFMIVAAFLPSLSCLPEPGPFRVNSVVVENAFPEPLVLSRGQSATVLVRGLPGDATIQLTNPYQGSNLYFDIQSPNPNVSLVRLPLDGGNPFVLADETYDIRLAFSVPHDIPLPALLPLEFIDHDAPDVDTLWPMDFELGPPATLTEDNRFGAMAFWPPRDILSPDMEGSSGDLIRAGKWGYVTVLGGSLAVFDTETERIHHYDSLWDRNSGYGIKIVEPSQTPGKYYAYITNHTVDYATPCGLDEQGENIGNTVQVIKLDPLSYDPDSPYKGNERIVGIIDVGCGPQGIDFSPPMDDNNSPVFAYVANAYDGTVSVINTDYHSVYETVDIKASGESGSRLYSRGVAVDSFPDAFGTSWARAFVTYIKENGDGEVVMLDAYGHWPTLDIMHRIDAGAKGTVGVAVSPDQGSLVLVNDGSETEPDSVSLIGLVKSYDPNQNFFTPKPITREPIPLSDSAGRVSGFVDISSDGKRAYIAREADDSSPNPVNTGIVVVDIKHSPLPISFMDRLFGCVGMETGLFGVFRKPLGNKIYQSNIDAALNGVYAMPEPLVIHQEPFSLQKAALTFDGGSITGSLESPVATRSYVLSSPQISPDETKIVCYRQDFAYGILDGRTAEIVTTDIDGNNEINLTRNTNPDDMFQSITDLTPAWLNTTHILFASRRVDVTGPPSSTDTDLFVMDAETGEVVKQLTHTDLNGENEVEPHAIPDPSDPDNKTLVVYSKSDLDPGSGELTPSIYKMVIRNDSFDVVEGPTRLTNPSFPAPSQSPVPFGDTDPQISPRGQKIVFSRHVDDSFMNGIPQGDWDIFMMNLDGSELTNISDQADQTGIQSDRNPSWAPDQPGEDSDTIAFNSTREGGASDVFIMNVYDPNSRQDIQDLVPYRDQLYDRGVEWYPATGNAKNDDALPDLIFYRAR